MGNYSVLGAGSGGQALSAILIQNGHKVTLWNRSAGKLKAIHDRGTIQLKGQIKSTVPSPTVTNSIAESVNNSEIIFIVVTANAHYDIAKAIAPYVRKEQFVVLMPGRTAGCLDFKNTLLKYGCRNLPVIAETQSLFCACRASMPAVLDIISFKSENPLSCIPNENAEKLINALSSIFNSVSLMPSSLHTGLENIGAMLHPAPVILNTGWIESRDVFFPHYYYGISRSIAKFIEKIDNERLAVAKKLRVNVRSVKKWHEDMYGCVGNDLFETLHLNSGYASIDAPRNLYHRYLTEDIPTGLVPISELGHAIGTPTPLIDLIINLGSSLLNVDFRKAGRNMQRLKLRNKKIKEIKKAFEG